MSADDARALLVAACVGVCTALVLFVGGRR